MMWRLRVVEMIRDLLNFPYPTICRHDVALRLIGLLELEGVPAEALEKLAHHTVQANDELATEEVKRLIKLHKNTTTDQ
jgi:hypothetical protein